MEAQYQETLTERRRAVAVLELELEKERQRVKGYKQALISQSQQLMKERKQLQQVNFSLSSSSPLYCILEYDDLKKKKCVKKLTTSYLILFS